jgi:hypothetical protein
MYYGTRYLALCLQPGTEHAEYRSEMTLYRSYPHPRGLTLLTKPSVL